MPRVRPTLPFAPLAGPDFFLLGCCVALLGCAAPAWEADRAKPAPALESGGEESALSKLSNPWPAIACLLLGAGCTRLPPLWNLPVFGYLAVALLLIGGIALMPRLAATVFGYSGRVTTKSTTSTVATLALARLANAPSQASIALGGVLSSFSLMVAMAIMVASFRVSVDDWLLHLLSADMYARSAVAGNTGGLTPPQQRAIATVPGIARAEYLRVTQLTLNPQRPNVALLARAIDIADPGKTLPIVGSTITPPDEMPIWASEAMVDLYGYRPGQRVTLPLGGRPHDFIVAGIWRDYARQAGALQMRLTDYRALTGDLQVNDVALWLQPGTTTAQARANVRKLPFGAALEFSEPDEIRAVSLKIFDRSFAVTYLLEVVAIVIGLFGVAATFSAQTLARAKEFGMLRHIGVTRRQILAVLAAEGGLLTAIGIAVGFALGWLISLILIFIVNPQSFHWSMQLHMPRGLLAAVATALLVSAILTALVAGRQALSGSAIRAVREDW